MRALRCVLIVATVALFATCGHAGTVLLIGHSPSLLFNDGGLAQYGHTVTLGPHYDAFDGSIDLSGYDAIVLSAAFYNAPDMPDAGQQSIVDFVANGGGLITGEWLTWRIGPTNSGSFRIIDPILPAFTYGQYIGGSGSEISVNYQQVTPDPVLNAGLPTAMPFIVNSAGSEVIVARAGSTVFYSGDSISPYYLFEGGGMVPYYEVFPSAGLVGWNYGLGRVLTFSTTLSQPIGPDYTDNYSRLLANSIDWVSSSPAEVPEPNSLTLLGLGALGLAYGRRRLLRTGTEKRT